VVLRRWEIEKVKKEIGEFHSCAFEAKRKRKKLISISFRDPRLRTGLDPATHGGCKKLL